MAVGTPVGGGVGDGGGGCVGFAVTVAAVVGFSETAVSDGESSEVSSETAVSWGSSVSTAVSGVFSGGISSETAVSDGESSEVSSETAVSWGSGVIRNTSGTNSVAGSDGCGAPSSETWIARTAMANSRTAAMANRTLSTRGAEFLLSLTLLAGAISALQPNFANSCTTAGEEMARAI